MSKTMLASTLVATLLVSTASPVMAMNVLVQPDGRVDFFHSQVLGDSVEVEAEKEDSRESESVKKAGEEQREAAKQNQEKQRELVKKTQETQREAAKDKAEQLREKAKLIKSLPKSSETKLRIKAEGDKSEIRVETKKGKNIKTEAVSAENETEDIKISLPARENDDNQSDDSTAVSDPTAKPLTPERIEVERKRNQRENEQLEIRTRNTDSSAGELEMTSRQVRAVLPGAEVSIDPETRVVTVVTPTGEEKVLTHLPDQAVTRMQASGLVSDKTPILEGEVKLETSPDGQLEYVLAQKKTKKLFGFINRQVTTEIHVDDQSGATYETVVPAANLFGRIIDALAK